MRLLPIVCVCLYQVASTLAAVNVTGDGTPLNPSDEIPLTGVTPPSPDQAKLFTPSKNDEVTKTLELLLDVVMSAAEFNYGKNNQGFFNLGKCPKGQVYDGKSCIEEATDCPDEDKYNCYE